MPDTPAPVPAVVADAACVWVAVNRRDGAPQVTPVWFVALEAALWFTTTMAAHKTTLLRSDPRISLAIDDSAGRGGAVAEGRAELLDVDARPDVLAAFAAKYHGWDAADPSQWGERVLVRIVVDRWLLGP